MCSARHSRRRGGRASISRTGTRSSIGRGLGSSSLSRSSRRACTPSYSRTSPRSTWQAFGPLTDSVMRASPVEYLGLKLRAHEVLHDVPLYDVSVVDLPGGGAGQTVVAAGAAIGARPPRLRKSPPALPLARSFCCISFPARR